MSVRFSGNRDQAIVPLGFTSLGLLRFDHSEQPRLDEATDEYRFVHQHEDIEGIAILSDRAGDRSEIEWKDSALRQNCFQFVSINLEIERILVAAAFRSVDYDI